MTSKQQVLRRFPRAVAYDWGFNHDHYVIESKSSGTVLARARTRRDAWKQAAAVVQKRFKWTSNPEVTEFIADFERSHFRTREDSGANPSSMFLWNMVRHRVGLPLLSIDDLPKYDPAAGKYVLPPNSNLTGRPES